MNIPTRLRILDYLKKQHAASARELGSALGMTRANIRHHLVVLETSELVEVIGKKVEGRGRPQNVFGISQRSLGDGLDKLSSALLHELLEKLPLSEQVVKLESLAARLGNGINPTDGTQLSKRLSELILKLNDSHYQARWEAGATGARIVLGHCPFSAIINEHPELCRLDSIILAQYLPGYQVVQLAKLELSSQGYPQCLFAIG